jgi:NAD(P)-dependent dehydrogenase (short-subunit alcohol dehydrogenase family)
MPTAQHPLHSGFGPKTTAVEALAGQDLTGKIAIVTGGYSGLGLETTRVLTQAGATVVIPVRSPEKAQRNLAGLSNVELGTIDLTDPASIDAFAEKFLATGRALHLLIDCAGVMVPPLSRDAGGYESQFSGNHLGHFHLAARLWPALKAANGARVVSVSSVGHQSSGVDFDDPNYNHRPYEKWQAYGQSKTANALFAVELDRRAAAHNVRAFSLHPGGILTDLARHLTDDDFKAFGVTRNPDGSMNIPNPDKFKTVETGAATIVWCATSPLLDGRGGVYCEDCDIATTAADAVAPGTGVMPYASDPALAERLWALSEKLTGVAFDAT